jgi:membrane associated rhomboid family serine protease
MFSTVNKRYILDPAENPLLFLNTIIWYIKTEIMIYDAERRCYVDTETNTVIPLEDGDDVPLPASAINPNRAYTAPNNFTPRGTVAASPQRAINVAAVSTPRHTEEDDRILALQLQLQDLNQTADEIETGLYATPTYVSPPHNPIINGAPRGYNSVYTSSSNGVYAHQVSGNSAYAPIAVSSNQSVNNSLPPPPPTTTNTSNNSSILTALSPSNLLKTLRGKDSNEESITSVERDLVSIHRSTGIDAIESNNQHDNDWMFAKTLQAFEFENANDFINSREFNQKEYRASSCRRQIFTVSTMICFIQIILLIVMIQEDGYAPSSENPMVGPPVTTLVRFGAKETALMLYKREWWRLLSPIMLHAGIFHLLSNVFIQIRIGAYLNIVYGNLKWLIIYLLAGIFGNMMSVCFLPESVGVGSSGAVLGMLTSWVVWILFRWNKIPPECQGQRNCQLMVVIISVAITLGMSFSEYVDWGAHFGGAFQGLFLALFFLSEELDHPTNRLYMRIVSLSVIVGTYIAAIVYMASSLHVDRSSLEYWAQNDDFNGH